MTETANAATATTEQTAATTTTPEKLPPAAGTIAATGADTTAAAAATATGATAQAVKPTDATAAQQQPTWPENWRSLMAGGDARLEKQLERFSDPKAVHNSWKALQGRLSSGELRSMLPDNATPEQVAEWRKENNIPDNDAAYVEGLKLPNGMQIGEAEKPVIAEFAKFAHGKNWTPATFNDATAWYFQQQDKIAAERETADANFQQETRETLMTEWGPQEYRKNMLAVAAIRDMLPADLKDRFLGGRTADGKMLGDDPGVLKFLTMLSRTINPAATLVPASPDQGKAVDSRLAELKTLMADRRSVYWKGDQSAKLQQEYRDLTDAQATLKSRAA